MQTFVVVVYLYVIFAGEGYWLEFKVTRGKNIPFWLRTEIGKTGFNNVAGKDPLGIFAQWLVLKLNF